LNGSEHPEEDGREFGANIVRRKDLQVYLPEKLL